MKLYALYLIERQGEKAVIIDAAREFSDVSFLYRKNAIELADFAAMNLANSLRSDKYITAQEKQLMFFTFRKDNVATVLVASQDYPSRAAFSILREIMTEYEQCNGKLPGGKCDAIQRGIRQYQNPSNADKLLKIQENLEETQKIMTQNLEAAIGRGESLEALAEKSQNISEQSKLFAREAKKMNSCCMLI